MDTPETIDFKKLRLLFWNSRSLQKRKHELHSIIINLDIFICVESWLTADTDFNFPGFVTFRKDRQHARGGGILILIRKNIAFTELKDIRSPDQSVEICGIHINNVNPPLDILACYRSPGLTLTQANWNAILRNMQQNNCIFMGDFNSHNTIWNCRYTDRNGERLATAIDSHNLFLHNENSSTHIDTYRNLKSNLDLIFSSINISDVIDVKVCDETWGSDHYPIYVTVDTEKSFYKKKSFKIKSTRTDWTKFSAKLENSYAKFLSPEYEILSPSDKYDILANTIAEAVKSSTPAKKALPHQAITKNPVPWWDPDCDKVKRLRRAAYRKWEFTNNLEDLINYKKSCAIAIRTFKNKKKNVSRTSLKA